MASGDMARMAWKKRPAGRTRKNPVKKHQGVLHRWRGSSVLNDSTIARRTIAERLTTSVREVPHVTTFRTLDATVLAEVRGELDLSPLPLFVKAVGETCRSHPVLHSSWHGDLGHSAAQPHPLCGGGSPMARAHGLSADVQYTGVVCPVSRMAPSMSLGLNLTCVTSDRTDES